jgi:hypothetical protein
MHALGFNMRFDDVAGNVPSRHCPPRHRVAFNSRQEGAKCGRTCGGQCMTKSQKVCNETKRNKNETKTIYPAVIGRQLNSFSVRPITAGCIVFVFVLFSFRFVS